MRRATARAAPGRTAGRRRADRPGAARGDRRQRAGLRRGGAIDYVTLDFLAEITMVILERQRERIGKIGDGAIEAAELDDLQNLRLVVVRLQRGEFHAGRLGDVRDHGVRRSLDAP